MTEYRCTSCKIKVAATATHQGGKRHEGPPPTWAQVEVTIPEGGGVRHYLVCPRCQARLRRVLS